MKINNPSSLPCQPRFLGNGPRFGFLKEGAHVRKVLNCHLPSRLALSLARVRIPECGGLGVSAGVTLHHCPPPTGNPMSITSSGWYDCWIHCFNVIQVDPDPMTRDVFARDKELGWRGQYARRGVTSQQPNPVLGLLARGQHRNGPAVAYLQSRGLVTPVESSCVPVTTTLAKTEKET